MPSVLILPLTVHVERFGAARGLVRGCDCVICGCALHNCILLATLPFLKSSASLNIYLDYTIQLLLVLLMMA